MPAISSPQSGGTSFRRSREARPNIPTRRVGPPRSVCPVSPVAFHKPTNRPAISAIESNFDDRPQDDILSVRLYPQAVTDAKTWQKIIQNCENVLRIFCENVGNIF